MKNYEINWSCSTTVERRGEVPVRFWYGNLKEKAT
jgi:hypothetical protein